MPDNPDVRFEAPSSLCTTGLQAQIITGVFLQLLRSHFSTADRIDEERLKGLIWVPKAGDPVTPDPARAKISIEPVYRWDPRQLQSTPALVLKRNALTPADPRGIGNNEVFPMGGIKDIPGAGREYFLSMSGSHTIFCAAIDSGIAELLSTEVARELYQFSRVIIEEFGFDSFELAEIGPVARLEDHFEDFLVPVTFKYDFTDAWKITKLAPRFKGVSLTANP